MSEIVTQQEAPRAKLDLNFGDDDAPVIAPLKAEVQKKVQEISERSGFRATSPAIKRAPVERTREEVADERPSRKRAKTGRTHPFNTKIKPETYDELCMLADKATQREGRPVSLAEILERAIQALKAV